MTDTRVAVIGIGCRLPQARDHREFFANLRAGVSSVIEVTPDRWNAAEFYSPDITAPGKSVSKWCAQLDRPYAFDHAFFHVSPKEAAQMDPQQRLLLEEAWHCIEDAGVSPRALRDAHASVYVGVAARDHLQQTTDPAVSVDSHSTFGGSDYMLANRLSHMFGLAGLSTSLDAACASSLVAVHLGCQALLSNDTDYALAGGVCLNLHPWKYISYSKARMLSPTGLCKTFDEEADGFVPGDGVALVLLRRFEDAERDGDHIYGVLRGSSVNYSRAGRTITAPTVESQSEVIAEAMAKAGFDPATVGYVEAHGTGTALGDPVEVEALRRVIVASRREDGGCWAGSLKPNVGHLEAAAGVAGLIKVLMMMRERTIPPSIHLNRLNPLIHLDDGALRVTREETAWDGAPRRAGVSSFGAGGVNSHVCVEEYQAEPARDEDDGTHPFMLSAPSSRSLDLLLARWCEATGEDGWIRGTTAEVCATLATGRKHFPVRLGGVVSSREDIRALVRAGERTEATEGPWALRIGEVPVPAKPRLDALLRTPPFAKVIAAVENELLGGTLESLRAGTDGPRERCLFTFLLARVLIHLGFKPGLITGSGSGVFPALAAAGAIDGCHAVAGGGTLRAPAVPLVEPRTDRIIYPHVIDEGYIHSLLDGLTVEREVADEVVARAATLHTSQHAFKSALEEWSRVLSRYGWRAEADGRTEVDDLRRLIQVVAMENALDRLNRRWHLPLDRLVRDERAIELLDLLIDGVLAPKGLLSLLSGTARERHEVIERAQRNAHLIATADDSPYRLLRGRAAMPKGLDTIDSWKELALAGRAADLPEGIAVLCLGDVGPRSGAGLISVPGLDGLDDLLDPLMALWSSGVDVVWERFYEGRSCRKVELPTTEFVRTEHRQAPSAGTPVEPADRLVELCAKWQPSDPQPAPHGGPVLVVAPQPVIDKLRPAAGPGVLFVASGAEYRQDSGWDRLLRDLSARGLRPSRVVRVAGPDGAPTEHLSESILLSRALLRLRDGVQTLILDVVPHEEGSVRPEHAAVTGLAACLRWESSTLRLRLLALDAVSWERIDRELQVADDAVAVRYDGDRRLGLRHVPVESAGGARSPVVRPGGVYLIAGGAGGLGRLLAGHLLAVDGTKVALIGRSAAPGEPFQDLANAAGDRVAYFPADIAGAEATRDVAAAVRARFGPINGVIHAAGVLRDGYLVNTALADIEAVLAPKADGAVHLDLATRDDPLDFFVLFSSLSAVTGNVGQAGYACANAFLDAFAIDRARRRAAGRTISIGWPWWDAGGMTVPDDADTIFRTANGFAPMPVPVGLDAFDRAVAGPGGSTALLFGDPERALAYVRGAATPPGERVPADGDAVELSLRYLTELFGDLLGVPAQDIDPALSLDNYGLDSILIRNFNSRVQQELGSVPQTLLFECKTLGQAAARIADERPKEIVVKMTDRRRHAPAEVTDRAPAAPREDASTDIAIIGIAGRYPQAPDLETFWRNLVEGVDCVTEIPASRWDHRLSPADTYCKWGAFLDGVDRFDPLFFNISPREAELMDPQERLFLQTAWHVFEDAGYPPARLGDRDVGVFVGVTTQTYLLWGPDQWRAGNMVTPTSTPWSIPNRVSYWLDLRGPSMPVDTACASSLTAIHLACRSIARRECRMALAGGVNLYLHPSKYDWLCQLEMVSHTGRCHTFGAGADGFVPGEGVGAVLLKPLTAAIADGDRILAVIKGTAVNHGGRTNGFTVPNPNAQAAVVETALREAGIDPATIGYVEAHGTGTDLGDPIEIAGLSRAFRGVREACPIGSVKTNIGHLESAAGIAGLTKVLLQLRHQRLAPSLHATPPNPRIDFAAAPFRVVRAAEPWPSGDPPRRAGVSSFGAGGANAHVIVEEYRGADPPRGEDGGEHLITVSAKNRERLREHCRLLASQLRGRDDVLLSEVAYQLQVRREPMPERAAILVTSVAELCDRLSAIADSDDAPGPNCWLRDRTAKGGPDPHAALAARDLAAIARSWVAGADVPWESLYDGPTRHVTLPGYPFADERYWVPDESIHPFVTAKEPDGSTFSTRFTGREFFLDDHRVDGEPIFPAVGYLEMARAALAAAGHEAVRLRNNVWSSAILVNEAQDVRLRVEPTEGGVAYEVYRLDGDGGRIVCGTGKAECAGGATVPRDRIDLDAIRDRCPEKLAGRDYYPWVHGLGLQLGPSYQGVQSLCWGRDEAVVEFRLPEHLTGDAGRFMLHPAALDSALQGSLWLLFQHEGLDRLHLPFMMGGLDIAGPTPRHGYAHIELRSAVDAGKRLDVRICDAVGNVVLRVRDLWLRPWQPSDDRPTGAFLRPAWRRIDPPPIAARRDEPTWIFAPSPAMGREIADELDRARAAVITPADRFRALGDDGYELNGSRPEDFAALLASAGAPRDIVYAWPKRRFTGLADEVAAQLDDGLVPVFHLTRTLMRAADKSPVNVVCAYPDSPGYEALGGFLRTAERESARLRHRTVQFPVDAGPVAARLAAEVGDPGEHREVRYADGQRWVRRWDRFEPPRPPASQALRARGVYVVTGGAGGLGALVARWLAAEAAARVVLAGRSPQSREVDEIIAGVRAAGGDACYVQADVATAQGASAAVAVATSTYGPLHGVFHAAGVLRDGYIAQQDPSLLREVLRPKVDGALHLDAATAGQPLDFFCLFSSLAGVLGNAGQAGYAYANSFLDAFAEWREAQRRRGRRVGSTVSVDWALWAEGGMRVDAEVEERLRASLGLRPLRTSDGLTALAAILKACTGRVAFAPGIETLPEARPEPAPRAGRAEVRPEGSNGGLRQVLAAAVAEIAKLDPDRVEHDENIGSYGFDSLAFNRLANQVSKRLGVDVTPATFFEYTTVADLADHLQATFSDQLGAPAVERERQPEASAREPVAIIGMQGLLPQSNNLAEFWAHLEAGHDLITEIPESRWDWRAYEGESISRWGAFLREIDTFDARFFGISPREAELMDPQQRLFLQVVYGAIEDAGYQPADLAAGRTGLFVGAASHDYYDLQRDAGLPVEAYTTTGYFHSILANRVSYLLNLKGPSVPVDAACSSALVAVRAAIESIWAGSSDVAIAGGVNLLISPMIYISFSRAGMLSPAGRCRVFDEAADGYVRGEGVGAILLKPLSRALRDGDHVHAVIRGSAINHGGKVNTLTTPNPNAQAELIVNAFEEADVDPSTVGYMETHGTGTALGDPIEVNGLKKAFKRLYERAGLPLPTKRRTLIGSVKSNVGHLEAAAGIAGLFKIVLAMKHGKIPGNLHINRVNPHIRLDDSPFEIARDTEVWPRPTDPSGRELPRRAGVSSFGFGGINAHLLVEEHLETGRPEPDGGRQLIVLSAKTPEQLRDKAADLSAFLAAHPGEGAERQIAEAVAELLGVAPEDLASDETLEDLGVDPAWLSRWVEEAHPSAGRVSVSSEDTLAGLARRLPCDVDLAAVAYTLQVGREPMRHRLAVLGRSAGELATRLTAFAASREPAPDMWLGTADKTTTTADARDLRRLARHWVEGGSVDWRALHHGTRRGRLPLPTYPFARTRHWLPRAGEGGAESGRTVSTELATADPTLAEHRVNGKAVLPGVGHLALAHAALGTASPGRHRLTKVVWLRPLAVDGHSVEVRVHLESDEYRVQAVEGDELVTYSQGRWEPDEEAEPAREPVEQIYARCPNAVEPDALYARFRELGLDYGPLFRGLRDIRTGESEVIARVTTGGRSTPYTLHPTLMDAALQAIAVLADPDRRDGIPLPFSAECVRVLRPLPETCHAHVRSLGPAGYDVRLLDELGRTCVSLAEVAVRTHDTGLERFFFIPFWKRQAVEDPAPRRTGGSLIVHPADAFGLEDELAASGQAWRIRLGSQSRRLSERAWEVDATDPEDLARRIGGLGDIRHVWFLGGILESSSQAAHAAQATLTLFRLIKALSAADRIQRVQTITVLVNGVHEVGGRRTDNPFAAGLVGLAKSLGKELPWAAVSCVDIGVAVDGSLPGGRRAALVRALLDEGAHRHNEEVAFLDGQRYVKRLRPAALGRAPRPAFRDHGTYLIVGGMGGIGLTLARHLAATRAARLVLVGRSPETDATRAELARLATLGGEAVYRSGDVADPARMREILDEAKARYGAIHGVVHAGMVLRDGIVERLDEPAFLAPLAPKADGSRVLGELLEGQPLDVLLFLSSVQSFTGAAGQGNYAAASAVQDAYGRYLASRSAFPVKVVNWGYWGTVGSVASEEYQKKIAALGFRSISPAEGMEAVERILACDEPQVVAASADENALEGIGVHPAEPPASLAPVPPLPLSNLDAREGRALDAFIAAGLLAALRRRGLLRHAGAAHAQIARDLRAAPKYDRLIEALVEILVRHGFAERRGDVLIATEAVETVDPAPDAERLRSRFPDIGSRIDLVTACLEALPQVLSGELVATEVIFPGGSMELVGPVYSGVKLAAYCNRVLADQAARHAGDRPVKILEIGAGTGSTTEAVLARLGHSATYVFTDVSEAFVRQAERDLTSGQVAMSFRRLDIEQPVEPQGFTPGGYDLVLAGNVLHATSDVAAALRHVRSLLAPGGRLILSEVTRVQPFHTVTFGLLDGWWRYRDGACRLPHSPLLDVAMWRGQLERAGFTGVAALGHGTAVEQLSQHVIVADAGEPPVVPAEEMTPVSANAPSEDVSRQVSDLIAEVTAGCLNMPVEEVTRTDPLSSFGVDSIVGVELINKLNDALGIVLKTITIFDHPTIADLAGFIVEKHGGRLRLTSERSDRPAPRGVSVGVPCAPAEPDPARAEARALPPEDPPASALPGGEPISPPDRETVAARVPKGPFLAVRFERPGSPADLTVAELDPVAPGRGEIEVLVRAFPINFSDLLLAKGLYPIMPDYPFTPGVEVSGVVRRVGPGVERLRPGDEVIALTRPEMGGQASVVITDESFAVRKPATVTHEEACGFAAPFLAMYLAFERAAVQPGERVLIPAATGTNALIALQLARLAEAEVIATAGARHKVEFLDGLGVPDAIDYSRVDVVEEVRRRTGGRGVDAVINTLGGEAIQQGLNMLAPEGRYVEIAVFGLQASRTFDLSRLVDNQSFHSFNAKKYFLQHPEQRVTYLETMASYLGSGKVKPIVGHVLPFDRVAEAYALKEDRATIGRIVVTMPEIEQVTVGSRPPVRATDIAVIGMSARLPGAPDVATLWDNLAAGRSAIREVPADRWAGERFFDPDPTRLTTTYCNRGGFIDDVDRFDAPFFNISGKEAEQTDPQQRIFLEEAWKALEDAGYTGEELAERRCGVFVGAGASEYLARMTTAGVVKQAQAFWGNEASVLAARIAYFLNLKGPSIAVNTACSSSLVALHLACQSLITGESETALTGGVFITLVPDYFVVASNGNMLSPEGRCKTFDASADGFGPGEGVGVLVLKRLDAALRDRDHIYGVIKGTAVNQDGRTNGITAPSGLAQTQVELSAYERAGVDPSTIGNVEAHGTGTRLGDPIELEALTNAFRTFTDREQFCAIGSIKTNIGHTAAAAGVAGVIKVLLSFQHGKIPASLNYEQPNPLIDFARSPFYVNTELRDWAPVAGQPRRAAVSGFGFSGTNAHVVLEEPPPCARPAHPAGRPIAVPLSARTPSALAARVRQLAEWLDGPGAAHSLAEIGYNLQAHREHFTERVVFVAADLDELRAKLRSNDTSGGDGLARRYLAGEDVDWRSSWAGEACERISLPTYPFDRHRYWYTEHDVVYAAGSPRSAVSFHPVPSDDGVRLETTLTGQEFFLRHHRVRGRKVLPGVLYPELVRRAAGAAGLPGTAVRRLAWLRPLEVGDDPVTVAVRFDGSEFEVRSLGEVVHARGVLAHPAAGDASGVDLAAEERACARRVPVDEHYRLLAASGLTHGPALAAIEKLQVGDGRLLARLRLPDAVRDTLGAFHLHPALLDGALQTLAAFDGLATGDTVLPFSVGEVAQRAELPATCYVRVRRTHDPHTFDVQLLDDDGRELVSLTDLVIKAPGTAVPRAGDLREVLLRLSNGEISEAEAEAALEVSHAN